MRLSNQPVALRLEGVVLPLRAPSTVSLKDGREKLIVKLMNGQIRQQTKYTYKYTYKYHPNVLLYSSAGGCKMMVEGMDKAVRARKLR